MTEIDIDSWLMRDGCVSEFTASSHYGVSFESMLYPRLLTALNDETLDQRVQSYIESIKEESYRPSLKGISMDDSFFHLAVCLYVLDKPFWKQIISDASLDFLYEVGPIESMTHLPIWFSKSFFKHAQFIKDVVKEPLLLEKMVEGELSALSLSICEVSIRIFDALMGYFAMTQALLSSSLSSRAVEYKRTLESFSIEAVSLADSIDELIERDLHRMKTESHFKKERTRLKGLNRTAFFQKEGVSCEENHESRS